MSVWPKENFEVPTWLPIVRWMWRNFQLAKSSHVLSWSPFQRARQKSFSGCAVGKSIEKAETIIIWPSNWTETSGGWCPNTICRANMVSPRTTRAVITIITVLCQERSNWPTGNGYDVLKVENFEAVLSNSARVALRNRGRTKTDFKC